ncbi:disulfide bond formation protein B [Microbulbifer sp. OS29]|uniref:Disulfide bond formation protein B n=1 Tax=Microbulbifer okhotskensis TaxID=2926617 RepID=A0A9X2J3B9_9GAMM|nr:disulfide bond formation protein B [Microbulbifer okhotskensis]MCO1332863.1 disulfide bond formation protein B [Microbulbifer okhotskensis]
MVFTVRKLDSLALLAITVILWIAFLVELVEHQIPCPLCLLQRVAFTMAGVGLMMNLRFNLRPEHYGIVTLSSLSGLVVSVRQILLHIMPDNPGYGNPVFGLHLYTWSALIFFALLIYSGVILVLGFRWRNFVTRDFSFPEKCIVYIFFTIVLANLIAVVIECGVGPCSSGAFSYHWLWN